MDFVTQSISVGQEELLSMFNTHLDSMTVQQVRWVLVSFVLTMWVLKSSVSFLNVQNLDAPLDPLIPKLYGPDVLKKYERHKEYIRATNTFSEINGIYGEFISFTMWFGGLYASFDEYLRLKLFPDSSAALHGTLYMLFFTVLSQILDLPWGYYKTFILEERFGFNRSTISTWIKDFIKGI